MCQYGHIQLSAEDRKNVRKLSGILIPVYASAVLALVFVTVVAAGSRQGELIASTAATASPR